MTDDELQKFLDRFEADLWLLPDGALEDLDGILWQEGVDRGFRYTWQNYGTE